MSQTWHSSLGLIHIRLSTNYFQWLSFLLVLSGFLIDVFNIFSYLSLFGLNSNQKKVPRSDTSEAQKKGIFGKDILSATEGQKENTHFIDLHPVN